MHIWIISAHGTDIKLTPRVTAPWCFVDQVLGAENGTGSRKHDLLGFLGIMGRGGEGG